MDKETNKLDEFEEALETSRKDVRRTFCIILHNILLYILLFKNKN